MDASKGETLHETKVSDIYEESWDWGGFDFLDYSWVKEA